MSWLIKIRYSKIVLTETEIWASPNTIKSGKFYKNVISPEWKMTEWTKNKGTYSAATLLGEMLLGLSVSFNQTWVTFVKNKTFENDPWKLMGWDIPSTKQEIFFYDFQTKRFIVDRYK